MLSDVIRYARGEKPVDLLLKNARLVNVLTGEIYKTDVAVYQLIIVGFGDYQAKKTLDLKGLYLAPGFIDGHIHIESTMLQPTEFARAVLPHGTTSVICDPHEIANVLGIDGIRYILQANNHTPLSIYVMLPACVPATPRETSGARLESDDLRPFLNHPYVLGLAEVMNYPGVLSGDKGLLRKITLAKDRLIDGHSPGLAGKPLYAYITAGIRSDHETTRAREAREKLRAGMYLMIREGSAAKNLPELIKVVNQNNARRCMLVSDDRHPVDLMQQGHLNHIIRKAIRLGLSPVEAIRMVTLNPAEYFRLNYLGAIAPGRRADMVAFDNFRNFRIKYVWKNGKLVARNGNRHSLFSTLPARGGSAFGGYSPVSNKNTIHLKPLHPDSFCVPAKGKYIRIIELVPHQIITRNVINAALVKNGEVVSDTRRDILKCAVIERHKATGNIGLGFVRGFGLKKGAIGSSVGHDSHNIIVVGTNDDDMQMAVKQISHLGGGQVVVAKGRVLASLPLPIAGIISDKSLTEVAGKVKELHQFSRKIGCKLSDPFMTLSFLPLAPIPELKLTDKGLVDVNKFQPIPLFP